MVGGMLSSTVLTLVVIPAVYSLWQERRLRREHPPAEPVPATVSEEPALARV
jgi:Cu(I)/Ag(I) efflux system membrane protein CusA/SilA